MVLELKPDEIYSETELIDGLMLSSAWLRRVAKHDHIAAGVRFYRGAAVLANLKDASPGAARTDGFVYFIQAGDDGPIKIGTAVVPEERLRGLQTAHHEELRILAVVAGGPELEAELHERFQHARIRGEWFRRDEALLLLIAEHMRAGSSSGDG